MTPTTRRVGALAVGGALLFAACGGDDAVPAADPATGEVATTEQTAELPEPAPGPIPDLPVAAGSVSNPLPEVAVRQINGDGGWVQFKNLLPSDQPVLIWFWAPH